MNFKAHERSLVESDQIGEGTRIWAHAHVCKGAIIGKNCNIGDACYIEGGAVLGNGVVVKNNIAIYAGVNVSDFAFLGPNVVFTNDMIPRSRNLPEAQHNYDDESWLIKTHIGVGASLGANVTVVCGVTIGEYSFIGAGAVVTKDVAPYTIVYGNPARVRGVVCRCGKTMDSTHVNYECSRCDSIYKIENFNVNYLGKK